MISVAKSIHAREIKILRPKLASLRLNTSNLQIGTQAIRFGIHLPYIHLVQRTMVRVDTMSNMCLTFNVGSSDQDHLARRITNMPRRIWLFDITN